MREKRCVAISGGRGVVLPRWAWIIRFHSRWVVCRRALERVSASFVVVVRVFGTQDDALSAERAWRREKCCAAGSGCAVAGWGSASARLSAPVLRIVVPAVRRLLVRC